MKNSAGIFSLLAAVAICALSCSRSGSAPAADYLRQLDSLIVISDQFETAKLQRIGDLQVKLRRASTPQERYRLTGELFDEYSIYNSDSARLYINRNIALAKTIGDRRLLTQSYIRKSNLLTGTGMLSEARSLMEDSIARTTLEGDTALLIPYYDQMIFLYSHMGNYAGGNTNEYYAQERTYKDSILDVIPPNHPDYLWFRGWSALDSKSAETELMGSLRASLENSPLNRRHDARNAYVLARLYKLQGDSANFKRYMAVSAMADVRLVNSDIAALEDLAKGLFADGKGDIDRAYAYINYCLHKAITYPNRVHAVSISGTINDINHAYQERSRKQQERTNFFLILVCILAAVLIVTVLIIIVQNRRLAARRESLGHANKMLNKNINKLSEAQRQADEANAQLARANARLKELNSELLDINSQLHEANYVKEEYIGYVFTICSNYIRKLEELRTSIHSKAVKKKYREIEAETAGIDTSKDELKDFYRSFDTIFLHIYPDFVSDFNKLLQPDKQITPKEGELLTTELRIYALVRLGITDSVKIADFLHCSAQTVYNNRFRVRNKSSLPRKEFVESVRKLGTFMDKPS